MSWGILFRVRARGNPPLGFCAAGILFRVRARGDPPLGFGEVCLYEIDKKINGFLYISVLTFGFPGILIEYVVVI